MSEPESEAPMDERVRRMIELAYTDDPPEGHRERMLAAFEADDAKHAQVGQAVGLVTVQGMPVRKRRSVWPAVAVVIVAIAAIVALAFHYRDRPQRLVTPGVDWTPGTAAPRPPQRGP